MNNSIGWVQFKLTGGGRALWITTIAYTAFAVGVMFLVTQLAIRPSFSLLSSATPFFTTAQLIILLIYGTMRVGHAVRHDVSSSMLESHRLMPVTPIAASLGYVFGSTTQAVALFGINIVLGAACVMAASVPVRAWIVANAVVLLYAILLWTIVAFFSFRFAGAAVIIVVLQVLALMSGATPVRYVPGLAILVTPTMGHTVFSLGHLGTLEASLAVAGTLQVVIIGIYFVAASRRFSHDDVMAFDSSLSMMLLLLWVGASLTGLSYVDTDWIWMRGGFDREDLVFLFVSGYVSVAMLAILPVSAAVRFKQRFPVSVVLLATAVTSAMLLAAPITKPYRLQRSCVSAIAVLAFLISIRYVLGIAIRRRWRTRLCVAIWIFVFWVVPAIADAISDVGKPYSYLQAQKTIGSTWNQTLSLPGILYGCWESSFRFQPRDAYVAAAVQVAIAAAAAALYYVLRSDRASKESVLALPPISTPAPADLLAN